MLRISNGFGTFFFFSFNAVLASKNIVQRLPNIPPRTTNVKRLFDVMFIDSILTDDKIAAKSAKAANRKIGAIKIALPNEFFFTRMGGVS